MSDHKLSETPKKYEFEPGDEFVRYDPQANKSLIRRPSEIDAMGDTLLFTLDGNRAPIVPDGQWPDDEPDHKDLFSDEYTIRKQLFKVEIQNKEILQRLDNLHKMVNESMGYMRTRLKIMGEKQERIENGIDNIGKLLYEMGISHLSDEMKKDMQRVMEKAMWPGHSGDSAPAPGPDNLMKPDE